MAQADEQWAIQVEKEVSELTRTHSMELKRWKQESIYRIPWSMKKLCRRAYQPHMVSIGPYHHGERQLKGMEPHKHRAFLNFLWRSNKPLECYMNALRPVTGDLMAAYDQLETMWKEDTSAFLRLMIVDGCFVLELMRNTINKPEPRSQKGYVGKDDPVFSSHGKVNFKPHLRRDMLMLENQLPLSVLIELLTVEGAPTGDNCSVQDHLTKLILKFLDVSWENSEIEKFGVCVHILDMYRRSLMETDGKHCPRPHCEGCYKKKKKEEEEPYIRSATELIEAGINFGKSKTRKLDDISFERGVLRLPRVTVDDALESDYLNMMAFERCHVGAGNVVTSYVHLMDRLIDNAKDVSLLYWKGIVQNSMGSDEAVATLFNSISKDTCLGSKLFYCVHMRVAIYSQSKLRRSMAEAKHRYFTNPWVGLSVFAATFLFALAALQTVFAVLDYKK